MIVLDASAALELLVGHGGSPSVDAHIVAAGERVHVPHLFDVEVAQVLRRWVREGALDEGQGLTALGNIRDLRIVRHEHFPLLSRIWELRANLTAYDATYVALAERLDATLVTHDERLARAPGHHARIDLV